MLGEKAFSIPIFSPEKSTFRRLLLQPWRCVLARDNYTISISSTAPSLFTDSDSDLVDLTDVTLADEDAFSKVFEVAADVENEESFRHSFNNDT